jgi:hypothetical protein
MKKLSETYKELGIAFSFPIRIEDAKGNETYFENRGGFWFRREYDDNCNMTYYENGADFWCKREYDDNCNMTYYEDSNNFWCKREYDDNGHTTHYETSDGDKKGTPQSQSCDGKVIEVDGKKYKLTEL